MVVYKKKTEQAPSTKPPIISKKGGASASAVRSLPTHEKLPEEHTSKEGLKKINPTREETDPEERLKKQRTEDINPLIPSATTAIMSKDQPSAGIVTTKGSKMPASRSF